MAQCPKCSSNAAWFVKVDYDVVLRCFCGLYKVVASQLNLATDGDGILEAEELNLPRRDSNLWVTLMVLASLNKATSLEIKTRLVEFGKDSFTVSDVASYLTILRSKGLVRTTEVRRGTPGGSTWMLTDQCVLLIGV